MATLKLSGLPEEIRWTHLTFGFGSFAACLLVHHLLSRLAFRGLDSYRSLSWQMRMEWDSRIVSSLHAAIVTVLSLYLLVREQTLWDGKVSNPTPLAGVTLSISAAYMLADSVSMPLYWRGSGLIVYWLHHGLAAACFLVSAYRGILQFFALLRLTSELSTPFLNITWFCKLGRVSKDSFPNVANSFCLTASYLVSRVAVIPVYWYYVLLAVNEFGVRQLVSQLDLMLGLWLVSSVVLDAFNIYWARKVVVGGFRTIVLGLRRLTSRSHAS